MKLSPPLQSLAAAFRIPLRPQSNASAQPFTALPRPESFAHPNCFSTTSTLNATKGKSRKDPRITLIRYHLHHPLTPRPLRLSRHRTLRHWTIHRAAQLLLHKTRRDQERELERQYNAMRAAMEELRLGVGDGGKLYRQAVDRKGIYGGFKVGMSGGVVGNGGVPIEYARGQTEGPAKDGWDEGWTRG